MNDIKCSKKNFVIRKAVKEDGKALIEYINIIGGESDFLTFGKDEYNKTVEDEEEFIVNALNKENALFIIAEIDGKVVGNLNFSGGPRERTSHVGEFGVSVLKEYWGNGIGKELVKYLIDWSKNSGIIKKINLRVRSDNKVGIALYNKLGFVKEGILKRDFWVNGVFYDSIAMGLVID
ncbi:GNAT family protein [Clostridium sp. JS66]|uniref:GNAT family N-acetyltransferase n=1 Tax=Clostridium sp. JS66 TaxID=3064705 RepID=UPI00298DCE96|nr:GNAT family protein [Clostridium sp. JS66]WPC39499.1 GNAT family protein [Clostridium sp. JS66]